jgi:hypothetical protein
MAIYYSFLPITDGYQYQFGQIKSKTTKRHSETLAAQDRVSSTELVDTGWLFYLFDVFTRPGPLLTG